MPEKPSLQRAPSPAVADAPGMQFRIVAAPPRNAPRNRSPRLSAFISAVHNLKTGEALLASAEQIGWPADTKALTSRIYHICENHGIKVCTETQADGATIKVWQQKPTGASEDPPAARKPLRVQRRS